MTGKQSSMVDPAARFGSDAAKLMSQYAQMNIELLQAALKSVSPMMSAWTNWYQALLPPQARAKCPPDPDPACCDIPETECPPRCACTIRWEATQGDKRKATVVIHNTSKESITYQLSANPFESCGKPIDAKPVVSPQSVAAPPDGTVTVTVQIEVGELFQPGAAYTSEVLVSGKYERCVRIELEIRCECEQTCRFDHGEIPIRKRADDWYRHFQCSEPCFEPVRPRTNVPATDNQATGTLTPPASN